jgi:hypothetical protein
MEVLSEIAIDWDRVVTYLEQCSSLPWRAAACRPLWGWLSTGLVAVGTFLLLWAIWKLIASWFRYRAALRAAEYRRRVESYEVLKMDRRSGGDDFLRGPADAAFYARLKEGLERQQLHERGARPPRLK